MVIIRVNRDLEFPLLPSKSTVSVRILAGGNGFCIQGRVFISRKTGFERLQNRVPGNRFLQEISDKTKTNKVFPYRTDDRD